MRYYIFNLLIVTLLAVSLNFTKGMAQDNDLWQATNGPYGGEITSMAINPAGHIYVSARDGVYYSVNNGENWMSIKNGLPEEPVNRLALNSEGHIYVATFGLYVSTDNGENWNEVETLQPGSSIPFVIINPNDDIFIGNWNGIQRLKKGEDTWQEVNEGLTDTDIRTIFIKSNGDMFAGTSQTVYRSTNNGDNWTNCNTDLPPADVAAFATIPPAIFSPDMRGQPICAASIIRPIMETTGRNVMRVCWIPIKMVPVLTQ